MIHAQDVLKGYQAHLTDTMYWPNQYPHQSSQTRHHSRLPQLQQFPPLESFSWPPPTQIEPQFRTATAKHTHTLISSPRLHALPRSSETPSLPHMQQRVRHSQMGLNQRMARESPSWLVLERTLSLPCGPPGCWAVWQCLSACPTRRLSCDTCWRTRWVAPGCWHDGRVMAG